MSSWDLSAFKAYDIRGTVPDQVNSELAYRVARAYATLFCPSRVAVGRDVRPSGEELVSALTEGFVASGVDVVDIGVCGTEEVYFATFHLGLDGGIMVTASHNPPEYNGMKLVRSDAIPVSSDSGLRDIAQLVENGAFTSSTRKGTVEHVDLKDAYVDHLLTYVDVAALRPLRLACNPGNGAAGPVLKRLEKRLPFTFIYRYEEPDGTFPNGVPNPLLQENRAATAELVQQTGADMGIAWDGDFDRCFFFDERGEYIEGYYIVGLLAKAVLEQHPGAVILYDPRLVWNTLEIVEEAGGRPILCKSGHAFIKEKMRAEDAVYGGEMSAHHYFRNFHYCDSGMIPWLLVTGLLSKGDKPLSKWVAERIERYPCSGEINRVLPDPQTALRRVEQAYRNGALSILHLDGLSVEFPQWRFNLRLSNTEPLVRLNVETRGDRELLKEKTAEVLRLLDAADD